MVIKESGMTFGDYPPETVFYIEKSAFYQDMGNGVLTVEFILNRTSKLPNETPQLLFVEAKSSSPKPGNRMNFEPFIDKISSKFIHSLEMFAALSMKNRDEHRELPKMIAEADYGKYEFVLVLVIKGHEKEWLSPIVDGLNRQLIPQKHIWKCRVVVLNDEMARARKLIA